MANIFKQNLDVTQHPNRNNFDLTHKVHGTYKFGTIYPFLCKPVVPGDSFEIDTACGFQFMPMPFPTQSNMRVIFHYFYVRNKNIWENWENFAEGLEDHTPPYIEQPASFFKTGSLADYLDIPTSLSLDVYEHLVYHLPPNVGTNILSKTPSAAQLTNGIIFKDLNTSSSTRYVSLFTPSVDVYSDFNTDDVFFSASFKKSDLTTIGFDFTRLDFYMTLWYSDSVNDYRVSSYYDIFNAKLTTVVNDDGTNLNVTFKFPSFASCFDSTEHPESFSQLLRGLSDFMHSRNKQFFPFLGLLIKTRDATHPFTYTDDNSAGYFENILSDIDFSLAVNRPTTVDVSDFPQYSPYYNSVNISDTIKISALPFRAYESIYNAYYRNTVTQPFTINGQRRYNRYNTNLGDGADTFDYKLMQRNWELDAYTSCLPSPQQGNAPLVGMNVLGEVTIEDENGITTAKYQVDGGEGKVVVTSPLASVTHGRVLMDLAQSGISINDFRQCNALQRYLEQNIRSGYKYIDYIAGQFGVRPKYNELDMPEFIGGFTQRVDVGMISNTNGVIPSDSDAFLGSYAGQAKAFGGSPHLVKHYCDDYGFIVGVMMIVPDGAYSQVLPKHFLYNKQLDWYIPLFSEIGMQPITYEELCPIQSHMEHAFDNSKRLQDTFGYQRPNHELVWYPDTVHGEFRLSLKDYLINRVFKERPELGNDFLIIKPEETNSIFNRTEPSEDVVIGQIVCKITAKRPVPRIVIPSLGR